MFCVHYINPKRLKYRQDTLIVKWHLPPQILSYCWNDPEENKNYGFMSEKSLKFTFSGCNETMEETKGIMERSEITLDMKIDVILNVKSWMEPWVDPIMQWFRRIFRKIDIEVLIYLENILRRHIFFSKNVSSKHDFNIYFWISSKQSPLIVKIMKNCFNWYVVSETVHVIVVRKRHRIECFMKSSIPRGFK